MDPILLPRVQQLMATAGQAVRAAADLTSTAIGKGASLMPIKRSPLVSAPAYIQDHLDGEPRKLWTYFGFNKSGATIADSTVDDLATYLSLGGKAEADYDGTFLLGKTLSLASGAKFNGQGALFRHEIDAQLFTFTAPITLVGTVSAIDAVTADYSAGTVSTPTPCTKITLSSVAGVLAGDILKIGSMDYVPEVRLSDGTRKGEFFRVASVDGANNTITTYTRLTDTYTVGNGCIVMRPDQNQRLDFQNFRFTSGTSTNRNGALVFTNFLHPFIRKLRFEGSQSQALRLVGCYGMDVADLWGRDLFTGVNAEASVLTLDATGYLLASVACQFGGATNLFGHNIRHIFTTSPPRISDTTTNRYDLYGPSSDILVSNVKGEWLQGVGLDTHDDGRRIKFVNAILKMAFNGPRNAATGVGLRGLGHECDNVRVHGGSGFRMYTDSTDLNAGSAHGGHILRNCSHIPNPNENWEVYSVRVSGNSVNSINPCRVEGGNFQSIVNYAPIRVSYGTLIFSRPDIKWTSTTSAVGLVRLEAGGFVEVDHGKVDFTGTPSGTGARLVKWDSSTADNNCGAKFNGTRIVSPAVSAVAALFDLSGFVGNAEAWDIKSTYRTGYPEGYTGLATATITTNSTNSVTITSGTLIANQPIRGASITDGTTVLSVNGTTATLSQAATASAAGVVVTQGRVAVDLKVLTLAASNPAITTMDMTTAGGAAASWRAVLDLNGRAQRELYLIVTTDVTGGALSSGLPGAFVGQRLRVENSSSSTQNFAVWRIPSAKINLPYNVTLGAGEGMWLRWDGTYWVADQMIPPKFGSKTWDPPSLATGTPQSTTVTVSGASATDFYIVSHSQPLQGTRMWAEYNTTNTVTVYHRNDTGATVDVASGTVAVIGIASK